MFHLVYPEKRDLDDEDFQEYCIHAIENSKELDLRNLAIFLDQEGVIRLDKLAYTPD